MAARPDDWSRADPGSMPGLAAAPAEVPRWDPAWWRATMDSSTVEPPIRLVIGDWSPPGKDTVPSKVTRPPCTEASFPDVQDSVASTWDDAGTAMARG